MLIQAGAEPVDESRCADMQICLICLGHLRRTGAEGLAWASRRLAKRARGKGVWVLDSYMRWA